MELFYRTVGEGEPLVILHGLYGMSDNWLGIARHLASHYQVFIPDQRNHGRSPHHPEHTYPVLCDDIKEFTRQLGINRFTLMGHSMGGKVAMLFALKYPQMLRKLVVVDIPPVDHSDTAIGIRQLKEHEGIMRALMSLDLPRLTSRHEADTELQRSIASPAVRQFLLKSLARNKDGSFYWMFNVPVLYRSLPFIMKGIIPGNPFPREVIPTLFIKGVLSDYIVQEDKPVIRQLFPDAEITIIDGAGHWVHVDKQEAFLSVLDHFLQQS